MFFVICFLIMLFLGVPIAFVLGLTSLIYMLSENMKLLLIPQRMFISLDSFVLMAIPFFVLTGGLMNAGGLTIRLVNLSRLLVGRVRGGFAMVNILVSMLFAGISGSATADTSAVGSILIPAMKKDGYDSDFAAAVTAASSCVGPIIPPSIVMVIYGVIAEQSIGRLFLAGFVPGVLLGLSQMGVAYYLSVKRNYPKIQVDFNIIVLLRAMLDALPALLAPVLIIGGILSGVFTPTEAGAVAAFYTLMIGFFYYRELKIKDLPDIIVETAKTTAAALMIVSTGALFGWILTYQQIPVIFSEAILSISTNRFVILLLMNGILLFVGCFMETIASLLILTPIFLAIGTQIGVDPIHLGMIMVLNLVIGLTTPPVGVCLFIACRIAKISLERVSKAIWPFILVSIFVLLLVTYVPWIVTFIPNLFFGN